MGEYDLVIKNGTVIDTVQGINIQKDVGIKHGLIVAVENHISDINASDIIDATGMLVTPGLVDLHVHVWWGVAHLAIEADSSCVARGATTVVDAGSSGSNTFPGFRRFVIDSALTRIYAFLNISGMGQLDSEIGELEDMRWARPERAQDTANANQDIVVGIKVRLSESIAGANDVIALDRALEAARHINKPLMVHIGDTNHSIEEIFGKLQKGDIVTHSFTPHAQGIIGQHGRVIDSALEARGRGVVFDVGHGAGSFGFEIAESALAEGFIPSTVSSDVHRYNVLGPVYDLTTTLSKYLHLGLSLNEVIAMGTENPARAVNKIDEIGTLTPGTHADIAILRLENGAVELMDSLGATRVGEQMLLPVETLVSGRRISPYSASQHDHSPPPGF